MRDLDRVGRRVAVLLAVALLVAPVVAFVQLAPDWAPANDNAVMALRALDVGGSRTPLLGQPTTARNQLGDEATTVLGRGADHDVYCLGPLHYYLLAPAVRRLGAATGMLLVSVLLNGAALLLTAWAVFRQLGPTGGVAAVAILGAITFTTGATSLVNPLNSMVVAYPLILSVVLSWGLLGGDRRLLPLTVGVVTFTAQQHLSIVPLLAATFAVGLAGLAGAAWRVAGDERRELVRWGGIAAGVGAVLWAPTAVQQLTHEPGNLGQLWLFVRSDARATIGLRGGVEQVAHVLGLPPVLGQRDFGGRWLLAEVALGTWLSVAAVVVALALVAVGWSRPGPRRDLVVMTGVLGVAAVVNASQVPAGVLSIRTDLSHWAWPLVLFVTLALVLAATDVARASRPLARRAPVVRTAALVAAVVVAAGPALVNPFLDRPTSRAQQAGAPVERHAIDAAADAVAAHGDDLDGPLAVLVRGQATDLDGLDAALALALEERGHPATLSAVLARNLHPDRLVDPGTVETGLVLVVEAGSPVERPPGELVADVRIDEGVDLAAYDRLLATLEGADAVRPGPEMRRLLDGGDREQARLITGGLAGLRSDAARLLGDPTVVRLLVDYPLAEPRLDPRLLHRLLASLDGERRITGLRVYLLDRSQLLAYASRWELEGLAPSP